MIQNCKPIYISPAGVFIIYKYFPNISEHNNALKISQYVNTKGEINQVEFRSDVKQAHRALYVRYRRTYYFY